MLKNLKYTLFIIVSLLFFNNLYSQGWPRVYGDNIRAHVYDLKEDYDNGYLIAGHIDKGSIPAQFALLIKTDINGEILWEKKYGDLSYSTFFAILEKTNDGGMIMASSTSKYGTGKFDPMFIKLNACGEIEWCTVLQSPNTNYGTGIIPLSDGCFVGMMKYYGGYASNFRISLVKLDATGEPVWIQHLAQEDSTIYNEEGYYLSLTSDSNYLVSGRCFCPGSRPFWIMTDTLGNQIWDLRWGGGIGPAAHQTVENSNGNFYSSGGFILTGHPMTPTLFKFDKNGNQLYYALLLGDTIDGGGTEPLCLFNDSTILVGLNWSDNYYPDEGYSEVFMIDTLGNIKKRRLLIEQNRPPWNIIKSFDNKILVSGSYYIGGNWDIYLFKLNENMEDDTLYSQTFTYDSLCQYQITSDTTDLNCNLFVDIEEIPLRNEVEKPFKIWPNPARVKLELEIGSWQPDEKKILQFYDIFGRKAKEIKISKGQQQINVDVSNWRNGLYIAVLKDDKKLIAKQKFMVLK